MGSVHGRTKLVAHGFWNVLAQYRSVISLCPGRVPTTPSREPSTHVVCVIGHGHLQRAYIAVSLRCTWDPMYHHFVWVVLGASRICVRVCLRRCGEKRKLHGVKNKNKKIKVKRKSAKYGWRVCVRGRMCCERFRWALHVVGVRGDLLSSVDF